MLKKNREKWAENLISETKPNQVYLLTEAQVLIDLLMICIWQEGGSVLMLLHV